MRPARGAGESEQIDQSAHPTSIADDVDPVLNLYCIQQGQVGPLTFGMNPNPGDDFGLKSFYRNP